MFNKVNPLHHKHVKPSLIFSGLLLLMATLLVCSLPATSKAEEAVPPTSKVEKTAPGASNPKEAPCNGLKPYENLDELLYQIYSSMGSDCLFEMPVEELEKIWGIKILDEELAKPKTYYPLSETEFYNKPYKSEKDAFYLERIYGTTFSEGDMFIINATKEYSEKQGASFFGEKLPELLPKPNRCSEVFIGPPSCNFYDFLLSEQAKKGYSQSPTYRPHKKTICYEWNSPPNRYAKILLVNPTKVTISRHATRSKKEKDNILEKRAIAISSSKEGAQLGSDIKAAPCKGLKPITNLNELLYQIYINSDSDCLAQTTLEEMEEIWDIKIFSSNKMLGNFFGPVQAGEGLRIIDAMKKKPDFYVKPYKSEKDAFVVERNNSKKPREYLSMKIEIADEYYEKHATLFPGGNFPKMLPYPSIEMTDLGGWSNHLAFPYFGSAGSKELIPENNSEYVLDLFTYSWFNSSKARVIQVKGNSHGRVTAIEIYSPGSATGK